MKDIELSSVQGLWKWLQISALYLLASFVGLIVSSNQLASQDLIAYYDFNNSVEDQSGNQNHGRLSGRLQAVPDRFGRVCSALLFDGQTYVEVPNSSSLASPYQSLTISVWFKLTDLRTMPNWLTVVCKGKSQLETSSSPQYRLQVQQNLSNVTSVCNPYSMEPSSTLSMSTGFTKCDPNFLRYAFQPGIWTFFSLTYDGSMVRCYSQGQKVFEQAYSDPLVPNSEPLYIGIDVPGQTEFFSGVLDDLRIYGRALSDAEVFALYQDAGKGSDANIIVNGVSNIETPNTLGSCGARVDFQPPNAQSTCLGPVTLRQIAGPPSGSVFPIGRTRIDYEASVSSGKSVRSSFYITVKDVIPPQFTVPPDVTYEISNNDSGYAITRMNPQAFDDCGIKSVDLISGPKPGQKIKPGKYRQIFQATDIHGNTATVERNVVVIMRPPPPSPVTPPSPVVAAPPSPQTAPPNSPVKATPKAPAKATPATPVAKAPQSPKDTTGRKVTSTSVVNRVNIPIPSSTPSAQDSIHILKKTEEFLKRSIEVTNEILVDSDSLTVYLYDNGIIDDDTVSLYINGKLLLANKRISETAIEVRFALDSLKENLLSLYAENLGSIPPNTAYMVFMDGVQRHELELSSTDRKNGTLRIRRKSMR